MSRARVAVIAWIRQEWFWLSYVVIFLTSFAVLLVLQSAPVFADPDSFYHVKMALLMRDQGIIREFPWLSLTTLGSDYTNQHLIYHALLIPFVTFFPPLIGMKIATVVFGSTLFTVIYWFLRSFGVRWAFAYPLILLFIRPFTFRIALAKAPSTSLIFLIIGVAWIFRYQLRRLFVLAFTYVWYYGGFPLLGVMAAIWSTVSFLANRFGKRMHAHRFVDNLRALVRPRGEVRSRRFSPNWAVLLVTSAGLAAGLIVNPYFPTNLAFYQQQLFNIGIVNFQNVIGVGAEWYPYDFGELAANGAFASILILFAVLGIVFRARAQSKRSWALLVMMLFFMALTLKSRRYVEYYIPFAVLFSAMSISDSLAGISRHRFMVLARGFFGQTRWLRYALVGLGIYFAIGVGFIAGRDFAGEMRDLRSGYRLDELQASSTWLTENTPAGSRVVHSDWDEFPLLFYHNSHNTYIAGLDPTFLYQANENIYWTWVDITLGKYSGDVYRAVTETLGASYVFLTLDHGGMQSLITRDGRFVEVYRDDEAVIYRADPSAEPA